MQEIGSAVRAAASFDRPVGGGPAAIGRAHHFAHFVHDELIPRGKVQLTISYMELNSRSLMSIKEISRPGAVHMA
jgi:hypothetical protein